MLFRQPTHPDPEALGFSLRSSGPRHGRPKRQRGKSGSSASKMLNESFDQVPGQATLPRQLAGDLFVENRRREPNTC